VDHGNEKARETCREGGAPMSTTRNEPAATVGSDCGGEQNQAPQILPRHQGGVKTVDVIPLVTLLHQALRDYGAYTNAMVDSEDHLYGLRVHYRGRVWSVIPEVEA
jgi:hypothetical protein